LERRNALANTNRKEVSVLTKQGYKSAIDKFKLEDENKNDLTEQILHLPKVYLIFSYKPNEVLKEHILRRTRRRH
jgi:hypothetical protein